LSFQNAISSKIYVTKTKNMKVKNISVKRSNIVVHYMGMNWIASTGFYRKKERKKRGFNLGFL
jgi:hypothetical protein